MGRIPDDVIEAVRAAADVVDLVSERVELKGSGDNLKGLCPFHNEKTPSFNVNRQRGSFYCFGCQTGGDAFGWLMKVDGLNYPEAVRRLGERYGINIQDDPGQDNRAQVLRANQVAMRFYSEILHRSKRGADGRDYLRRRNIHGKLAVHFNLGYAPGGQALRHRLQREEVPSEIALEAGLLRKDKRGQLVDWFRERVIFPIFNPSKKVLGFGARTLGDAVPKYLNTPESPLFSKRRNLYGIHLLSAAQRQEPVLVVEGYTDVILCHHHGFERTVAGLGTAFTAEQGKLLRRFGKAAVLLYDADDAGLKAAEKSARILEDLEISVAVATLEDGLDPCDTLSQRGPDALRQRLEEATPILDFKARRVLGQPAATSGREKNPEAARELLELVRGETDPLRRASKLHEVSEWTGFEEKTLREFLARPVKKPIVRTPQQPELDAKLVEADPFERQLMLAILQNPEAHPELPQWLALEDIKSTAGHEILQVLLSRPEATSLESLQALLRGPHAQSLLAEAALNRALRLPLDEIRMRLEARRRKRRLSEIQRRMKQAREADNKTAEDRLLHEYMALKSNIQTEDEHQQQIGE